MRHTSPSRDANDSRGAYCPRPDRRVRRAVRHLLAEPDQGRRGEVALALIIGLIVAIMLGGIVW